MEKILVILIALKQYIKEYHWLAESYQEHILADKLEEDLEDYIDEVAEISLVTETPNVEAKHLFGQAENYLNGKDKADLNTLADLFIELQEQLQSLDPKLLGLSDLAGRLSNTILRKLYLIKLQLGK